MKYIVAFILALSLYRPGAAQDSLANPFVDNIKETEKDDIMRKRILELALQNSDKKISDYQTDIAKQQIGVAKSQWLNTIFASSYWNEFSISPPAKDQFNFYYPKYNFGVNIPLGIFISAPKNVKIARTQYHIAQESEKIKILSIKNEILSKFEDYLMFKRQLTIQTLVSDNEYNAFLQVQKKFRAGEVTIVDYNKELQTYNDELVKKITLAHNLALAKLSIEEMIGVDLDSLN